MSQRSVSSGGPDFGEWFSRPPFYGLWVVAGLVLGLGMAAIVLRPQAPKPEDRVVMAPAPEQPAFAPSVTPNPAPFTEPDPRVSVHAIPGANAPTANEPAANGPAANTPADNSPATNGSPLNGPIAITPSANRPRIMVRSSPLPDTGEPTQPPPAPEVEKPAPAAPPVNTEPDVRPMEPAARPRFRVVDPPPRPASPPAPEPVRETGRVSIFFDADSSTYDHHGNRMPLRVEVYVDGQKRLTSDDPEKRTFNLGRIAEGEHDVEIVPYVGDLPSESRKERIRVLAGERNEYKAVLRRSDGASKVGKFRGRD